MSKVEDPSVCSNGSIRSGLLGPFSRNTREGRGIERERERERPREEREIEMYVCMRERVCMYVCMYVQSDLVNPCFFNPYASQSEHTFW